jgi:hypothetical protein
MDRTIALKVFGVVALLAAAGILSASPAKASMATYTTSLQTGSMCNSCGPFGTVTVSAVSGNPNEVAVNLTLTPGEVFAITGAGSALLFDIAGNPTLSVTGLNTGFSFHQASNMADGSGTWNSYISCDVCGKGTSPPENSGPINFFLSVASGGLSPTSFVKNANNYIFASDIGIPSTSGFTTGDVVTSTFAPVPLPAAAWLLLSGLGSLGAFKRVRATKQPRAQAV